ncbi:hypothetical protein H9Z42_004245 [Salmonella enterica]|nr:hypothetical protein [Salmonella enterica]
MKKYINLLSANLNYLLAALFVFMVILTDNIYEYEKVNSSVLIKECGLCIVMFLLFYVAF